MNRVPDSSNGRTESFEPSNRGSSPRSGANPPARIKVLHSPGDLLLELEEINDQMRHVMTVAGGTKDPENGEVYDFNPRLLFAAADGLGKNIERQVKIAKDLAMLKDGVVAREVFERFTHRVMKALEEFPEALAAVKLALMEDEG
jgi:hypothetical protein